MGAYEAAPAGERLEEITEDYIGLSLRMAQTLVATADEQDEHAVEVLTRLIGLDLQAARAHRPGRLQLGEVLGDARPGHRLNLVVSVWREHRWRGSQKIVNAVAAKAKGLWKRASKLAAKVLGAHPRQDHQVPRGGGAQEVLETIKDKGHNVVEGRAW